MSIANPLTASSEITLNVSQNAINTTKDSPLKPDLGVFSKDVVEISKLGLEKQQKETQVDASRKIEDIASEVVSISSTIGRARSVGNLTNSQATSLYNKIATLL